MSTFVCAEIGINHNGDLQLAKQLIDVAVAANCDAVKFQKRDINSVYTKEFLDSYRESPWGNTQREQKEGLELSYEEYNELDKYCKQVGIEWYASAWDIDSQKFLRRFECKYNKIASAMLTNVDLLEEVAKEKKYTFISTGMSSWEEIDKAVEIFRNADCPFELMHCISVYPMKPEMANLLLMDKMRERYGCKIGYSGHEMEDIVTIAAVAMGASSIEKHITMDRDMYGSDQKVSIEPNELKELVKKLRMLELIRGDGRKVLSEAEENVKKKLRG